jgi:hypothetical protein
MNTRFAPDAAIELDGQPIPAAMRASVTDIEVQGGFDGADRVDLVLTNDHLRWTDHPGLRIGKELRVSLGYAPGPFQPVFGGEITGVGATFPQNAAPGVTISAQDRRHRLQDGRKVRWFGIPVPTIGNFPLPDIATAGLVTLENILVPIFDPVGAAIAVLIGGIEAISTISDPGSAQKFIRKQANESDYEFLRKIAAENGWDMYVDQTGPTGGHALRFQSSLDHLDADVTLSWGRDLLDFAPRISTVGEVLSVVGFVWVPEIKMTFNIQLGWDWDRQSLSVRIYPGAVPLGGAGSSNLIKEPLTPASAARKLVAELIPKLNKRLTASGSCLGDPAIRVGGVLRIEGVGEQFGGHYRVVSVQHRLDSAGFRTRFDLRKEIWFGSIPAFDQGAVPIRVASL